MPFIPAVDCVEVVLNWVADDGTQWKNVLNFADGLNDDSAARCQIIADAAAAAFSGTVRTRVNQYHTLVDVRVTNIGLQDGPWAVASVGVAGSEVGNPLPSNVALCLTAYTNKRGRSFRGRIYHGGLSEASVSINNVLEVPAANIATAWNDALNAMLAIDCYYSIVSRYANGAARQEAVVTTVSDVVVRDLRVDTQRRRLPNLN